MPPKPKVPGLIKGLGVTFKEMTKTMFPNEGARKLIPSPSKGAHTVQYPHVKEAPPTRAGKYRLFPSPNAKNILEAENTRSSASSPKTPTPSYNAPIRMPTTRQRI